MTGKFVISILALSSSLAFAANNDVTICKLGDTVVKTTYQAPPLNSLDVEIKGPGGSTETLVGKSFQIISAAEVLKDSSIKDLMLLAQVKGDKLDHAAVSTISANGAGSFILVKFVGPNDAVLGVSGINGSTPFKCL